MAQSETKSVLCVCGEFHDVVYLDGVEVVPCPHAPEERIYLFGVDSLPMVVKFGDVEE